MNDFLFGEKKILFGWGGRHNNGGQQIPNWFRDNQLLFIHPNFFKSINIYHFTECTHSSTINSILRLFTLSASWSPHQAPTPACGRVAKFLASLRVLAGGSRNMLHFTEASLPSPASSRAADTDSALRLVQEIIPQRLLGRILCKM